jgi:hypothetical protein
MATKVVEVVTSAAGAFSTDINAPGEILAVSLLIGTLSTPDIAITDLVTGAGIFTSAGVAASGRWQPRAVNCTVLGVDTADTAGPPVTHVSYGYPVCLGKAHIAVTGAGDAKRGTIYVTYR